MRRRKAGMAGVEATARMGAGQQHRERMGTGQPLQATTPVHLPLLPTLPEPLVGKLPEWLQLQRR